MTATAVIPDDVRVALIIVALFGLGVVLLGVSP